MKTMKTIAALAAIAIPLAACAPADDIKASDMTTTATSSTWTQPPADERMIQDPYDPPQQPSKTVEPLISEEIIAEIAMESTLADKGIDLGPGVAAEYAKIVCEGMEEGVDPMMIALLGQNGFPEYTVEEHAMMVGASVGSHCPELGYIIDQMGD